MTFVAGEILQDHLALGPGETTFSRLIGSTMDMVLGIKGIYRDLVNRRGHV